LALREHSHGWGNGLVLTWVGLATWEAAGAVNDGGDGRNKVGWWWWWEESDEWVAVEPRCPIWPPSGRTFQRSHNPCVIVKQSARSVRRGVVLIYAL